MHWQAYSGCSAVGSNPTKFASSGVADSPDSQSQYREPIQQDGKMQGSRISSTLPWPVSQLEGDTPKNKNDQHPIVPTQSRGQPTAKPSCKSGIHTQKQRHKVHLNAEQDVEMLDVSTRAATEVKAPSNGGIDGSQDPIESYSGTKRGEDDMEVDVDEAKLDQPQPAQPPLNHNLAESKPSKEKVVAIAGPQKRRSDPKNHTAIENTKQQPTVKTGTLRRPPGVTIFQHSSLLSKSRERNGHKSGCGPTIASNSRKSY